MRLLLQRGVQDKYRREAEGEPEFGSRNVGMETRWCANKHKCSEQAILASEKAKETTSSVDINVRWATVQDAQEKSKEDSSREITKGEESCQQDYFY